MNISQRLRACAKHTGLDAVIELLTEAADEIDRLSASAALPTMRPGDSHMESLIEAAIQGHASTRDAMRWLVHQLVPHPSMATQAEVTDEQIQAVADSIPGAWRASTLITFARAILTLRPAAVPMTGEQRVVVSFLLGEGDLNGASFGDPHNPTHGGQFWWRKHLRNAFGITAQAKKEGA